MSVTFNSMRSLILTAKYSAFQSGQCLFNCVFHSLSNKHQALDRTLDTSHCGAIVFSLFYSNFDSSITCKKYLAAYNHNVLPLYLILFIPVRQNNEYNFHMIKLTN